jgi:hypothetical protein
MTMTFNFSVSAGGKAGTFVLAFSHEINGRVSVSAANAELVRGRKTGAEKRGILLFPEKCLRTHRPNRSPREPAAARARRAWDGSCAPALDPVPLLSARLEAESLERSRVESDNRGRVSAHRTLFGDLADQIKALAVAPSAAGRFVPIVVDGRVPPEYEQRRPLIAERVLEQSHGVRNGGRGLMRIRPGSTTEN